MIPKSVVCFLRARGYRSTLDAASREFDSATLELKEKYQLERFNHVWADAYLHVPFYNMWKNRYGLPVSIQTLDDLEKWPIIEKIQLQQENQFLVRRDRKPDSYGMTGGSTGEPLRFGKWKENDADYSPNMWLGRRLYGIEPGDRTFLLWGHQHLYGKGLVSSINSILRKTKDRFMNSLRVSAYDLSPSAMRLAYSKMIAFGPVFVIAFSPAMIAFCRTNRDNAEKCRMMGVKSVLCTAGPLSQDEKQEIESFFSAPVCMEYGSAECGVMAHTVPAGEYRTFWQTHILQTAPGFQDSYRNIVTCLTIRYFPLIRYDIGDYLNVYKNEIKRPHKFISVIGRKSDIVKFPDGTAFFGALVGDCVKQVPRITASQTIIKGDAMSVEVIADGTLTKEEIEFLKKRFRTVVPALAAIKIDVRQIERLQVGVGGKTPLVIYDQ